MRQFWKFKGRSMAPVAPPDYANAPVYRQGLFVRYGKCNLWKMWQQWPKFNFLY